MQKIQVQTEIDIKSLLSQLHTSELEDILRETSATLARRKSNNKKSEISKLLRTLNEDCTLPAGHLEKLRSLIEKRGSGNLSLQEQKELNTLIKEEETLRLKRIKILGKLAQIKGISLQDLTEQLGITLPENA